MGFVVGADGLEGGGGGVLLVGVLSFFPIALKTEEAIFDPPNTFELIPKALDVMFLNLGASEVSLDFEGSESPEGFGGSDKLEAGGGLTFESTTGPEVPGLSGPESPVGTGTPGGPDEPDSLCGPEGPVGKGAPVGPDEPDGLCGPVGPVGTGVPGGPDEPDGLCGPEGPVGTGTLGGPDKPDGPCGPDGPGGPVDVGTGEGLVVEEGSLFGAFFPIAVMTVEAIFEPPNTFELIPKALDVMFLNLGASGVSLDFEGSETPEGFGGSDKLGDGGSFPKGFDGINFVASEFSIGFEGSWDPAGFEDSDKLENGGGVALEGSKDLVVPESPGFPGWPDGPGWPEDTGGLTLGFTMFLEDPGVPGGPDEPANEETGSPGLPEDRGGLTFGFAMCLEGPGVPGGPDGPVDEGSVGPGWPEDIGWVVGPAVPGSPGGPADEGAGGGFVVGVASLFWAFFPIAIALITAEAILESPNTFGLIP